MAIKRFILNGVSYAKASDVDSYDKNLPEITELRNLMSYHTFYFTNKNLKISGRMSSNRTIQTSPEKLYKTYISNVILGQENEISIFDFTGSMWEDWHSNLIFRGTCGIYPTEENNATILKTESIIDNEEYIEGYSLEYIPDGKPPEITGDIHLLIKNGLIPLNNNKNWYFNHGIFQENALYKIIPTNETNFSNSVFQKTASEIQQAGFSESQANRLVEIMQVPHGQDPSGDEIVKLAQMGDIEGAKKLLGGDVPVVKLKQVYVKDALGKLLVVKMLDSQSGKLKPISIDTYSVKYIDTIYDAQGNPVNPRTLVSVTSNIYNTKNLTLTGDLMFDVLTSVSIEGLADSFCENFGITSISFPSLVNLNEELALYQLIAGCETLVTVSFPELIYASGDDCMYNATTMCPNLKNVYLPKLKEVSGSQALKSFCDSSSVESMSFDSLDVLTGEYCFRQFFANCLLLKDVYFPSLKTTSFGSTRNQFYNFLFGSGTPSNPVVIHFPSNLEDTIKTLDYYPLFGADAGCVVLAFDLPATS